MFCVCILNRRESKIATLSVTFGFGDLLRSASGILNIHASDAESDDILILRKSMTDCQTQTIQ